MKLKRDFFDRSTLKVAKELLGKYLIYGSLAGRIIETEAYIGKSDPACHIARGVTARNKIMLESAGHSYIYFIYGMYHCLNVVTENQGFGAAVLIRGVEPVEGIEVMKKRRNRTDGLCDGPGKLCQALGLTAKQNGLDMCNDKSKLYIEDRGDIIKPRQIKKTPRIGINEGTDKLWRFILE